MTPAQTAPASAGLSKSARMGEAPLSGMAETGSLHALVLDSLDEDQALDAGFRPGMGNVVPDRFFWALPAEGEDDGDAAEDVGAASDADAVAPKNPRHVH